MKTLLILLLSLTTLACSTGPKPLSDIDAFAASVVRTIPEVPSVAVAIVDNGKRHVGAFGYADVDKKVAATPDTGYYIGSTTKGFTGYIAAKLASEGKLDLDAPVTKYLPEVKFASNIDASKVTLRRLLSHTMSIQNNAIVYRTAFTGEHDPATLLRLLDASQPRSDAFRYDNLGYVIAGLVFERVTGRTWQQLHETEVFKPLGMTHSTAYMSKAQQIAMPYELLSTGRMELLTYRKNDQMMHGAGGTVMSGNDLARWLAFNLDESGPVAETHRQQTAVERPRGPFAGTAYGFGWYRGSIADEPVLFHGGGFEGWRSLFSAMPQRKLAVGVLTNSGIANPVNSLIVSYAYDRLLGKDLSGYPARLAKLRADIDKQKAEALADGQKRAGRQWTLTRDRASYAGRYENPVVGVLTIEERNGTLFATLGTMRAALEPFTDPDSARVELIPATGEVVQFLPPDRLKFHDEIFTKTP